jgi:protein translocase SecG subunit
MLMVIIVFQSGKNSGLSALSGKSDTYLSRNKAKSRDMRLALATKWAAGTFVILTVVLNLL